MAEILTKHTDLNEAAKALIDAANGAGGVDNITVILVRRREKRT
jgi:protein phosphatase